MKIDLHTHTSYSDGKLHPEELVRLYAEHGFDVISITDHDNIDALEPARKEADKLGLELIPGVEISTLFEDRDLHILGYYVELNKEMLDLLDFIRHERVYRAEKMLALLKEHFNIELKMERLFEISGSRDVIGRPHIAKAILEGGYCDNIQDAFDRFIGDDCPANLPKQSVSPEEAIAIIKRADGISVMAHPLYSGGITNIKAMIEAGIQGVEIFYPGQENHPEFGRTARRNELVMTGGSDFHGFKSDYEVMKTFSAPDSCVLELKKLKGVQ